MKLTDLVVEQAVLPDLQSTQRDDVIEELVAALIDAGAAPEDLKSTLIEEILKREKNGSTGFGKGVAVPHVKHPDLPKLAAAVGVSRAGIDFNALDKQPVYSIFLLLSPKDQPDEHLQAMESIFSNLQKDRFRSFLRQAQERQDIVDLLGEADSQQI
jgi:mannitol/fructose-specific phosphotransferase system IIA component (Ntr-type)